MLGLFPGVVAPPAFSAPLGGDKAAFSPWSASGAFNPWLSANPFLAANPMMSGNPALSAMVSAWSSPWAPKAMSPAENWAKAAQTFWGAAFDAQKEMWGAMLSAPSIAKPAQAAPAAEAAKPQARTVLINTFIAPKGSEQTFLSWWRFARMYFAAQPGFVSAKLHRSIDEDQRYRFVNILEWDSPESYQRALGAIWTYAPKPNIPGLDWRPELYEIVETA